MFVVEFSSLARPQFSIIDERSRIITTTDVTGPRHSLMGQRKITRSYAHRMIRCHHRCRSREPRAYRKRAFSRGRKRLRNFSFDFLSDISRLAGSFSYRKKRSSTCVRLIRRRFSLKENISISDKCTLMSRRRFFLSARVVPACFFSQRTHRV